MIDAELNELIARVWPEAYRIAYGILHDRGLAEDAAQETCASIAAGLANLKDPGTFRGWMYRIAANRAVSIGRARRAVVGIDSAAEPISAIDPATSLDIAAALAALPLEQRAVIILHYYAGLNSAEIAGRTGIAASTVRFRLMLARRSLRKALAIVEAAPHPKEGVSHAS